MTGVAQTETWEWPQWLVAVYLKSGYLANTLSIPYFMFFLPVPFLVWGAVYPWGGRTGREEAICLGISAGMGLSTDLLSQMEGLGGLVFNLPCGHCVQISEFVRECGRTSGNGDRQCSKALLTTESVSISHLETLKQQGMRSEECSDLRSAERNFYLRFFFPSALSEFFHHKELRIWIKCRKIF